MFIHPHACLFGDHNAITSCSAKVSGWRLTFSVCYPQGQGAITDKLRSFSMVDLTQIPQDDAGGEQYSSYSSSNPARRALASSQHDGAGTVISAYCKCRLND